MKRALLATFALVLVAACESNDFSSSENCRTHCRAGETCDAQTHLCIADRADAGEPPTHASLPSPVELTLSAPAADEILSAATLEVRGSVVDPGERADLVRVSIDDSAPISAERDGAGFAASLALPMADHQRMHLHVAASGPSLAVPVTLSRDVVVDRIAPRCGSVSAKGAVLTASAVDGDPQLSGSFSVAGAVVSATVSDGGVTGAWSPPARVAGELREVHVNVADRAGHTCDAKAMVQVDTVAPAVAIDPIPGGVASGAVHVTGSFANEVFPGTQVAVTLEPWHLTAQAAVSGTHFDAIIAPPVVDSTVATIHVTATDAAGNSGWSNAVVEVDSVPPTFGAITPANGVKLNLSQLSSGTVAVRWTINDGDPDKATITVLRNGGPWVSCTSLGAQGGCPVPAGTDDPASYTAVLTASDRAGNVATRNFGWSVDDLAPTFGLSVADWTRGAPNAVKISFSEQVQPATGQMYTLSPPAPALTVGWDSPPRTLTLANLDPGTSYTLTAAPLVTDVAGNPLTQAGQTVHFFTAPKAPANGAQLLLGDVPSFDATSDQDGVVSFGGWDQTSTKLLWARLDEKTAAVQTLAALADSQAANASVQVSVNSWMRISSGERAFSIQRTANGNGYRSLHKVSGNPMVDSANPVDIVVEAGPGEPRQGEDVGAILAGSGAYSRPGTTVMKYPSFFPQRVAFGSNARWELFRQAGSDLNAQLYDAVTGTFALGTFLTQNAVSPLNLGAVHLQAGARVYVFNELGLRREHCVSGSMVTDGYSDTSESLSIGAANNGNHVLGTRLSNGYLELLQKDASSCSASWTVIAKRSSSGVLDAKPVMFGGKPGAVYRTQSGLFAFVP